MNKKLLTVLFVLTILGVSFANTAAGAKDAVKLVLGKQKQSAEEQQLNKEIQAHPKKKLQIANNFFLHRFQSQLEAFARNQTFWNIAYYFEFPDNFKRVVSLQQHAKFQKLAQRAFDHVKQNATLHALHHYRLHMARTLVKLLAKDYKNNSVSFLEDIFQNEGAAQVALEKLDASFNAHLDAGVIRNQTAQNLVQFFSKVNAKLFKNKKANAGVLKKALKKFNATQQKQNKEFEKKFEAISLGKESLLKKVVAAVTSKKSFIQLLAGPATNASAQNITKPLNNPILIVEAYLKRKYAPLLRAKKQALNEHNYNANTIFHLLVLKQAYLNESHNDALEIAFGLQQLSHRNFQNLLYSLNQSTVVSFQKQKNLKEIADLAFSNASALIKNVNELLNDTFSDPIFQNGIKYTIDTQTIEALNTFKARTNSKTLNIDFPDSDREIVAILVKKDFPVPQLNTRSNLVTVKSKLAETKKVSSAKQVPLTP